MRYKVTLWVTPNGNRSIADVGKFLVGRLADSANEFEVGWGGCAEDPKMIENASPIKELDTSSENSPTITEMRIRSAMALIEPHGEAAANTHLLDAREALKKALDSFNRAL